MLVNGQLGGQCKHSTNCHTGALAGGYDRKRSSRSKAHVRNSVLPQPIQLSVLVGCELLQRQPVRARSDQPVGKRFRCAGNKLVVHTSQPFSDCSGLEALQKGAAAYIYHLPAVDLV